jgi:peptidylprolyl isomerase
VNTFSDIADREKYCLSGIFFRIVQEGENIAGSIVHRKFFIQLSEQIILIYFYLWRSDMIDGKEGKKITIHFTASLKNGEVIESTRDSQPIQMTLGKHTMFSNLEDEIATMKTGERKTIEVPCAEAFGDYHNELIITLPIENFPDEVQVGERYMLIINDSENMPIFVTEIDDDLVTVDGNHPLAGKDLIFDVELLAVA